MRLGKMGALALASTAMVLMVPGASAQQAGGTREYDVPRQDLGSALRRVAQLSGTPVIVPTDLVDGIRARALKGRYLPEEAVAQLLRGSRLRVVAVGDTLVVQREDAGQEGSRADQGEAEILVTGTRIRGHGPVGSTIVRIDRASIDQSGFSTTQDILRSVPQNFASGPNEVSSNGGTLGQNAGFNTGKGSSVNLRGLGASSTLVLLNGERPALGGYSGAFADVSMIPASAIARIEIVPDGASAIYGSDAVAGVVNIIPRLDFVGAESSFRIGTADGDFQDYQISQLFGAKWSSGHAMISYEFNYRGRLAAADRPFATDDLRAFGGPDNRLNFSNPGTITAGGRTYAIPRGQNGTGLSASMLTAGTSNKGDSYVGTDILPEQKRHSLFASFSQDLTPTLRFRANGLLSARSFDQRVRPSGDGARTVPVANPFHVDPIGTNQPISVSYSFVRDFGPETQRGVARAYGGTAGFELTAGRWVIDAGGTWGHQFERNTTLNRANTVRLAAALADTNPATAYNLLGDGAFTNPATIEKVRGSIVSGNAGTVWSISVRADGPLFTLPAGDVRLATGGEYRKETYSDRGTVNDITTATPSVGNVTLTRGPRTVRAAYGELVVPVFGEAMSIPGFRRLDLSAAVRTERYSDFGTTTNPKFGISWEPAAGITLRGSVGKSFRAPGFNDLRQDAASKAYFSFNVADPRSPTGTTSIVVLRGNDPDIRPERATTWTAGFDLRPMPGLHASATWFKIDYRDRISSPAAQLANFLVNRDIFAGIIEENPSATRVAQLYADPIFINPFGIPQANVRAVVDARLQNLSVVRQSGLDFDLGYAFDAGGGKLDFGVAATWIFHIKQALTETAPVSDVVDVLGNPVDIRARGRASWTSGGFGAALFVNYVDGYTNKTNVLPQQVSAWTTFDLQLSYRFGNAGGALNGTRISLSATNILDRAPPYAAYYTGLFTNGFDPENASPVGRVLSLQITKQW